MFFSSSLSHSLSLFFSLVLLVFAIISTLWCFLSRRVGRRGRADTHEGGKGVAEIDRLAEIERYT